MSSSKNKILIGRFIFFTMIYHCYNISTTTTMGCGSTTTIVVLYSSILIIIKKQECQTFCFDLKVLKLTQMDNQDTKEEKGV